MEARIPCPPAQLFLQNLTVTPSTSTRGGHPSVHAAPQGTDPAKRAKIRGKIVIKGLISSHRDGCGPRVVVFQPDGARGWPRARVRGVPWVGCPWGAAQRSQEEMSGESWGPGPCTGDEPEAVPRLGTPPSCLGQVSPFLLSSLPGFFRAWVCFHAAKPDGKLLLCPGRAKTRQSSLLETPLGSHPSSVWSPHPSGPSLVTPTAVPKTRGHATALALSHLLAPQPREMGQGGEPQNHGPAPPCVGRHGGTPRGSPWWKMRLSPKR